ncbi:hypothetical protein ACFL4G_02770 [Thermodesulfobacteriota bacterium]
MIADSVIPHLPPVNTTDPTCSDGIDNDCDGLIDTDRECGCFIGVVT